MAEAGARTGEDEAPPILVYGQFTLDVERRILRQGQHSYSLTPKECQLLSTFIRHVGQVLSRRYLMKVVWDIDQATDTRTLEVHIHWLRRKLETDVRRPLYLHTVRGVGYVLRSLPAPSSETASVNRSSEAQRSTLPARSSRR